MYWLLISVYQLNYDSSFMSQAQVAQVVYLIVTSTNRYADTLHSLIVRSYLEIHSILHSWSLKMVVFGPSILPMSKNSFKPGLQDTGRCCSTKPHAISTRIFLGILLRATFCRAFRRLYPTQPQLLSLDMPGSAILLLRYNCSSQTVTSRIFFIILKG